MTRLAHLLAIAGLICSPVHAQTVITRSIDSTARIEAERAIGMARAAMQRANAAAADAATASQTPGPAGAAGRDGANGHDGATVVGPAGPPGPASLVPGPKGDKGDTGATGAASTVPGPIGATGPAGAASTIPGPAGPAGATGAAGPAGTSGRVFLTDVVLSQTAVVALALGPKKVTVSTNCIVGDRLIMTPAALMPDGYMLGDIYCSANGTAIATLFTPVLALGANYSITVRITAFR